MGVLRGVCCEGRARAGFPWFGSGGARRGSAAASFRAAEFVAAGCCGVRGVCVLLARRGCVLLARRGSVISAVLRGRAGFAVSPRRLFAAGLAGARFRPCGILARGFRVSSARSQSFQLEVSEFRPNGVWSNEVLICLRSLDSTHQSREVHRFYRARFADSPGSFYARSVPTRVHTVSSVPPVLRSMTSTIPARGEREQARGAREGRR